MIDWIEWKGGECPVPSGTVVDVKDRDSFEWTDQTVGADNAVSDQFWRHTCFMPSLHIIAYRVVQS